MIKKKFKSTEQQLKNTVNDILSDLILEKKEEGITQDKQAKEIDISTSSLSKYANGSDIPNALSIIKMAKYYNVSTDYLLGLSSSKSPNIDDRKMADDLGLSDKSIQTLKNKFTFSHEKYTYNFNNTIDFIIDTEIAQLIAGYWLTSLNEEEKQELEDLKKLFKPNVYLPICGSKLNENHVVKVNICDRKHTKKIERKDELYKRNQNGYIKIKELEECLIDNREKYLKWIEVKNGKSEKN